MNIKKVLIVGSGTSGQQIGFQCATHGFETTMYDLREESLEACRAAHRAFAELFVTQRGKSKAEVDVMRHSPGSPTPPISRPRAEASIC